MLAIAELHQLLEDGRFDEALSQLEESLKTALTPEEHSFAAVELALLYVKIDNALTGKYLEKTAEIDDLIKQVDAKEREIDNEVAIAKIKEHISSL